MDLLKVIQPKSAVFRLQFDRISSVQRYQESQKEKNKKKTHKSNTNIEQIVLLVACRQSSCLQKHHTVRFGLSAPSVPKIKQRQHLTSVKTKPQHWGSMSVESARNAALGPTAVSVSRRSILCAWMSVCTLLLAELYSGAGTVHMYSHLLNASDDFLLMSGKVYSHSP